MAEKSKAKQKNESKYTLEELTANAEKAFKVKPEIVVGALHSKREQKEFTKSEVETEIKRFLQRKVR